MATSTFSNTTGITIPDKSSSGAEGVATQTLNVSGLQGTTSDITVTLTGLSHGFPNDLDFLLVAPDGTGFVFLSDAGGLYNVTNVTLTFSDSAYSLASAQQFVSGTFKPTDFDSGTDNFPGYAGVPISVGSQPAGTFATAFGGRNPNGEWTLYAVDDFAEHVGSLDGWSLTITDTGLLRLTDLAPNVTFAENTVNTTPQLLDADVTLAAGLNEFGGGTLVVSGLLAEDSVSIRHEGYGAGQIGFDGSDVSYGGMWIGTASGVAGGDFTVTFIDDATPVAIEALIENLTYQNMSDTPTATRTLSLELTAGNGIVASGDIALFTSSEANPNPFAGINAGQGSPLSFGHLNGDAYIDFVLGADNGGVLTYLGNSSGGFDLATSNPFAAVSMSQGFSAPALGDIDGDGDLDLVVTGNGGVAPQVWGQNGVGTGVYSQLTGAANPLAGVSFPGNWVAPALVDLEGDGDVDVVFGIGNGTIRTLLQHDDTFSDAGADNPFGSITFGGNPTVVPAFGDLNGDGLLDVVFGVHGSSTLRTFYQNADGTYVEQTGADNPFNGISIGGYPSPTLADTDGDGDLDLVITDFSGTIRTFSNESVSEITVTVMAENDAPVGSATADLPDGRLFRDYTISEADLLAGFSDPDGDVLTVENLTASEGTLIDNGDGTWTWQPPLFFTGEVTLDYQVSDGSAPALDAAQAFDIVMPSDGGNPGGEPPAPVIEGTPDNDVLLGTPAGDDVFRPLEGDDDVFGGAGDGAVILPGDADGYVFVQLADGRIGVLDIDPSDGDQGADVLDGIEFVRFGDENGADTPIAGLIDMEQPAWTLDHFEVGLVAATWQLFMDMVPSEAGFEYLIRSAANPTDLNDPYYAPFNAENTYLNFTVNMATGNATGSAWFAREFGDLSYEQAVEKAFGLIVTDAAPGGDPAAAKQFFLDAEGYFEQVAAERIVPGGVDLQDATKMALLSSVLYEAVKADVGPYGAAVNAFADQIERVGTSNDFLHDLLAVA